MAEPELANPGADELGAFHADTLLMHAELVELELIKIRREMLSDPGLVTLSVGQGQPAEQTIQGNQQDAYNGVVIFNPTPVTLSVGFQAGMAYMRAATVPPFSWAAFTERFVNLSVAQGLIAPGDASAPVAATVTVIRLRVPPDPGAGPYGTPSGSPTATAATPGVALAVPGTGQASAVAANAARRELTIVNGQATGWITLALGPTIPVAWAGIPLAPNGGSYQTSAYLGPVSILPHTAATVVSIAEA